ncbi:hypothetical protein BC628DRAFT_1349144 [Trametes gibbosa]|nr:hypothetical protein BC628DRAFT_1349144 [Trametes gibbosa]
MTHTVLHNFRLSVRKPHNTAADCGVRGLPRVPAKDTQRTPPMRFRAHRTVAVPNQTCNKPHTNPHSRSTAHTRRPRRLPSTLANHLVSFTESWVSRVSINLIPLFSAKTETVRVFQLRDRKHPQTRAVPRATLKTPQPFQSGPHMPMPHRQLNIACSWLSWSSWNYVYSGHARSRNIPKSARYVYRWVRPFGRLSSLG